MSITTGFTHSHYTSAEGKWCSRNSVCQSRKCALINTKISTESRLPVVAAGKCTGKLINMSLWEITMSIYLNHVETLENCQIAVYYGTKVHISLQSSNKVTGDVT